MYLDIKKKKGRRGYIHVHVRYTTNDHGCIETVSLCLLNEMGLKAIETVSGLTGSIRLWNEKELAAAAACLR